MLRLGLEVDGERIVCLMLIGMSECVYIRLFVCICLCVCVYLCVCVCECIKMSLATLRKAIPTWVYRRD